MLLRRSLMAGAIAVIASCATPAGEIAQAPATSTSPRVFTLAVLPDTQNYLDHTHQKEAGFPFNARELLFEQMRFVESRLVANGGDIAFVTSVGDVWQNSSEGFDEGHARYGVRPVAGGRAPTPQTRAVEMAGARQAFQIIAGKTPFSVVPGNHDYTAAWRISDKLSHVGGYSNFIEIFGADSPFFKGRPWYVSSFNGGANSAQIFEGGGYKFLHIGFEMSPADDVLAWASGVIAAHPGLPTIVSTHDFLNTEGDRKPSPGGDLSLGHPEHNNAEAQWTKFLSRHDQILLVLCGHQHGQSYRVDKNTAGHDVHQILADYQDRNRTSINAGDAAANAIGDGWLRLMTFDFSGATPVIRVRTYSSHFKAFASDIPQYAEWYRPIEQPEMSDKDFLAADTFDIQLTDFVARFGAGKR
jgi:3',5'-cyclic AMP phosphodiesterase CpdA